MIESTEKTTSCLAITEKRPHRSGGCVGIFFQLFDWNRRLAKKKLFSKKLLPPARAKQSSKKFGGDEKMPKTKSHLIDDENSRGFPNVKNNGNRSDSTGPTHEMRGAGLVARLMGLESLPAVQRDKPKKVSNSPPCDVREEKFVNCQHMSDMELLNVEKCSTKVESRPPKLQKTGQFQRRAVTRFGSEALQIRNVLSRARKHHNPKLASPVKSPRISSSRNVSRASRLIDAAARILEPGLQATNRAKCALTYSSSTNYVTTNEVLMDEMRVGVMSPDLLKQQRNDVNFNVVVDKSLMGQTSCKSCGNLPDVLDSRTRVEEQPFVCQSSAANVASNSLQGLERTKPRPPIPFPEQGKDVGYHRNPLQLSTAAERLDNMRACSELFSYGKPLSSEGQVQWQLKIQQCRPQKDDLSSIAFRERNETRNEASVGKSRTPPRSKLNNLQSQRASSAANAITGAKDFVALNRNVSGRTRPRVPTRAETYMVDTERKLCSRRDDSLSQLRTPVRKRRTVSVNPQFHSAELVSSTATRQKNIKCDSVTGKRLEHNAHNADHACIKTRSTVQGEGNRTNGSKDTNVVSFTCNSPLGHKRTNGSKDNNVVSFTCNSPLGHKTFIASGPKESGDHTDKNASHRRKLLFDENGGQTSLQRRLPLRGDTLGALLEQKLKELISQEEDELTNGDNDTKRSTATILQELISALTVQQPFSPYGHMFSAETTVQTGGTSVGFSHDADHLSPGSVLEASFSNESCFSSSLDDNSGDRLLSNSMYDQLQPIEADTDLLDSATSRNDGCKGSKMVTDICRILQSVDVGGGGLTGSNLTYANEVILNAEHLFGSAAGHNSERTQSFLIGSILFGELERLAGVMCPKGIEESKDSKVTRLLFDCVIECLESKYSKYCNTGFRAWRRVVPLCMNAEMVIGEVGKEVRRWTNLAGMIPDEIIEWEMSYSLGKWTDFEIEMFETGAQIDWDIFEVMIDEIVMDFLGVFLLKGMKGRFVSFFL